MSKKPSFQVEQTSIGLQYVSLRTERETKSERQVFSSAGPRLDSVRPHHFCNANQHDIRVSIGSTFPAWKFGSDLEAKREAFGNHSRKDL
jgi:hypothetical protein